MDGNMKIAKGAIVVMKGEKITANLFMLKGETLEEVDACSTSTNKGEKLTTMWHLRLGHMSERGLRCSLIRSYFLGSQRYHYPFVSIVLQASNID